MWEKMETKTIVYDLDTSGGLMEQIQALLAPPKTDEAEKRSRKPEKESRRSGRATNHDSCDSCKEGGDRCAAITALPPSTSSAVTLH